MSETLAKGTNLSQHDTLGHTATLLSSSPTTVSLLLNQALILPRKLLSFPMQITFHQAYPPCSPNSMSEFQWKT